MPECCQLCGVELTTGKYGHDPTHRTEHHQLAKRLENYLPAQTNETLLLCYFCHEEMLHAPILLPGVAEQLQKAFRGKTPAERLIAFAEVIQLGTAAYNAANRTPGP